MSTIHRRPLLLAALLAVLVASHAAAATLVVANKAEATASLVDLETGEVAATLKTGQGPHEVGISPDGTRALVTNYGQRDAPGSTMTLIDIPGAKVLKTIDLGDYQRPHGVEWLDGRHVAVTSEEAKALLKVDVESGQVLTAIDTDQEISHMVALGSGGRAYVANIGSGSITEVDLEKGEITRLLTAGREPDGMGWSSRTAKKR